MDIAHIIDFTVPFLGKPLWAWIIFLVIIFTLLALDLGIFNSRYKIIKVRDSLYQTLFYILMGLGFGGAIWYSLGDQSAYAYLTGYLVEKSLSLDNIFVMLLIFDYFKIPLSYQHRVLFLGIIGVIVLRAIMIGLGSVLIAKFAWITFVFAAFLIFTGIKILIMKEKEPNIEQNFILRFLRKHMRITPELHQNKFFVRLPVTPSYEQKKAIGLSSLKQKLWATPLFLALVLVEFSDIVFAVDSIPAIFTITTDPYIVYTSNIFAVLGLRALYYSLAAIIDRFHYLKYSLACILIFIGGKVFLHEWKHVLEISMGMSLLVTMGLIAVGVLLSILKPLEKQP